MFGLLLSIVINILSLGAKPGDENINNAPIINQAIHQCTEAGGGTVVIPSGEFTTGCIDGNNVRNALCEEGMRGPHTLLLASCDNCKVEDFEVKNSANYAFLGYLVNHASFTHLRILGGWDGIHIRGARNVKIERCEMHTGDNAIHLVGSYPRRRQQLWKNYNKQLDNS